MEEMFIPKSTKVETLYRVFCIVRNVMEEETPFKVENLIDEMKDVFHIKTLGESEEGAIAFATLALRLCGYIESVECYDYSILYIKKTADMDLHKALEVLGNKDDLEADDIILHCMINAPYYRLSALKCADKDMIIGDWFKVHDADEYNDFDGERWNRITFAQCYEAMANGIHIYDATNMTDSEQRIKMFHILSYLYGVDYDYIYDMNAKCLM